MNRKSTIKAIGGTFLCALALAGCIDDKYNLSDLDTTMRIGKGDDIFYLPNLSLGNIKLNALFDLGQSGVIDSIGGTYFLNAGDTTVTPPIVIGAITINKPIINPFNTTLDIMGSGFAVKQKTQRKLPTSLSAEEIAKLQELAGKSAEDIQNMTTENLEDINSLFSGFGDITEDIVEQVTEILDQGVTTTGLSGAEKLLDIVEEMVSGNTDYFEKYLKDITYQYNVSNTLPALSKIQEGAKAEHINPDVVDFKAINIDPITLDFWVEIGTIYKQYKDESPFINKVHLDEFTMKLPKGFHVTKASFRGYSIDVSDAEQGTLVLADGIDEEGYDLSHGKIQVSLTIDGASVSEENGIIFDTTDPNNHIVRVTGSFEILGKIRLAKEDFNLKQLSDRQKSILLGKNANFNELLPSSISFKGGGTFDKNLAINKFTGDLQHAISTDQWSDIVLNLPEFLTDTAVKLALPNPQLYMALHTGELPASIDNADVILNSYPHNNPGEVIPLTLANINLGKTPDGRTQVMCASPLCADPEKRVQQSQFPFEFQDATKFVPTYPSQGVNIDQILENVPDKIEISSTDPAGIMVHLNDCKNLDLTKQYPIQLEYKLYSPLNFSDDFKLVYTGEESEMDFGESLADYKFNELIVESTPISDLPLGIDLYVTPYSKTGANLSNLLWIIYLEETSPGSGQYVGKRISELPLSIRAMCDGKKSGDRFALLIRAAEGHTMDEVLQSSDPSKQFYGLTYRAVLHGAIDPNLVLKADQGIQLTDIRIGIQGGITITP